ncbi:Uncharacterised protein [Candidatus Tiddalikarchaeum anstoanum]|nr:Uncharacterised protein [Candidatus Tiddalikarchaeum anstoanum]
MYLQKVLYKIIFINNHNNNMIRKLQQSGKLYFVSLPIDWIKENKLKKGSELNFEYNNSQLILKTDNAPKEKKLVLEVEKTNPEGLIQLIIGAFESGVTDATIILKNELSNEQVKRIKTSLYEEYSLNISEISRNKIRVSIFIQNPTIEDSVKAIFNSTINLGRAALLKDKQLVEMHQNQVQFLAFTMKRIVNTRRELPNWLFIAEFIRLIARFFWMEYENKKRLPFIEKVLEILQKISNDMYDMDKLLDLYNDVLKLKELTYEGKERYYYYDRAYRSLVIILRELIKINLNKKL